MQFLYLASRSPRRRELLRQVGIPFRLIDVEVDESPLEGEAAIDYVGRLAREKAQTAARQLSASGWESAPVLAADTTVALDGRILGKPVSAEDAVNMLMYLSGRKHAVHTGVALFRAGKADRVEKVEICVVTTHVCFAPFEQQEIERYVATGEPMDKAGAYGIQGYGGVLVERIEGSYSNVVGLPIRETATLAARFGIACWQTENN